MPARTLLAAAVLFSASCSLALALDLTVVARGEAAQSAVQEAFVRPFVAATEISVQVESWDGGIEALRLHAKAADNTWDLVQVDPDELAIGCGEGLFEKLDWPAIGGKDHYLPQGVSDCGVGATFTDTVLAWDRDKFPVQATWADFWDVAKYPGKRGLRAGLRGNLEIALLADGVAIADVYKTLATAEGVDRAFRKLDQLRPYIVWWQTQADAVRILSSGDVLMTTAPSGQIALANRQGRRNFGIQWSPGLFEVESWAIIKGTPDSRLAQQFLYFAGTPGIEARLQRIGGLAGLAKGVNDLLPADLQPTSPTNPANLAASLRMDSGFWRDNLHKLRARFETLLGH